ncbi:uncharacterized protein ATNIH1004_010207 [Aspergillus tanneri]|uniref:Uncharacterized protein n=1 Tax=Aspergillus tanneri TaxID=1220188 RepID=A0A5M9M9A1_9EURO|nr:uncharacterized protein ATNIH1004_010207 [Aspergillus tanneri]KAA8643438.1 hypothetical protein ATNIH1004_010207 [Aspergillus tanneri]
MSTAIELTGASLLDKLRRLPGISDNDAAYNAVVAVGQIAYAESSKWDRMNDQVAVVI